MHFWYAVLIQARCQLLCGVIFLFLSIAQHRNYAAALGFSSVESLLVLQIERHAMYSSPLSHQTLINLLVKLNARHSLETMLSYKINETDINVGNEESHNCALGPKLKRRPSHVSLTHDFIHRAMLSCHCSHTTSPSHIRLWHWQSDRNLSQINVNCCTFTCPQMRITPEFPLDAMHHISSQV